MINKRSILFLVSFLAGGILSAQSKIGYLSLNEVIVQMPEYKKAGTDMTDYQQALNAQSTQYQTELQQKDSIFKADSSNWSPAVKEVKKREMTDLYRRVLGFNQQMQQLLDQREQELLGPIQQKATNAARDVARENGYAYVLTKEQLIIAPPGDDLLALVLKKLNIQPAPKEDGK